MEEDVTPKKSKISFKIVGVIVVLLIAVAGYAGTYYYYNQYKKTKIVLDNPEVATKNEVKEVTDKLSKIYTLPEGEEPQVATVLDKEKLKDQAFFAKAENGDKVIIYTKSQVAILYRPSENKIVNISPVSLSEPQPTPTEEVKPTEEPAQTE